MYDDELWIGKDPIFERSKPRESRVFLALFKERIEEYTFFDARDDIMTILSAFFVSYMPPDRHVDVNAFCRYVKNRMIREALLKDPGMDVFRFMDILTRLSATDDLKKIFEICMRDFTCAH
jgi:hypothetical protein